MFIPIVRTSITVLHRDPVSHHHHYILVENWVLAPVSGTHDRALGSAHPTCPSQSSCQQPQQKIYIKTTFRRRKKHLCRRNLSRVDSKLRLLFRGTCILNSTKKILLWREIVWPRRCFAVDLKARSHGPRKTQ